MRCMRYQENKVAIILDLVGNYTRHGLPDTEQEWSLDSKIKSKSKIEQDVLVRQCEKCYKCYKGMNRICPYCENDNGKTKKQIEEEKKAELEKIEKTEKFKQKQEVWNANTEEKLIELGKKRGYSSPTFWAKQIMKARNGKVKNK